MSVHNSNLYCIKKIGLKLKNNNAKVVDDIEINFHYNDIKYSKLFDFCEDTLIRDVMGNNDFSLRTTKIDDVEYLAIYLATGTDKLKKNYSSKSRIRLLCFCFENLVENELNAISTPYAKHTDSYVSQKLFDLLRASHENEKFDDAIENMEVQHRDLIPILRQYQKRAVKWLLHREQTKETTPFWCKEIYSPESNNKIFYLDVNNLKYIYDERPIDITLPTGGILADEMGLGKTIEIISLILLNPRRKSLKDSDSFTDSHSTIDSSTSNRELQQSDSDTDSSDSEFFMEKKMKLTRKLTRKSTEKKEFFCICSSSKYSENSIVKCKKCGVLQHSKCVINLNTTKSDKESHYCPSCWKNIELKSSATIIVTPTSIRTQWYQEILKHSKNLKVFEYNRLFNDWINPRELSNYDIILIDYNTLKRELHFLSENETKCNLRGKRKYMRITSPLMMIKWWRVCLDESQLIESSISNASKMVQQLKTTHRWSVTGTPIQKSINDLRGILEFLDIYPFYVKKNWDMLVGKFLSGNTTHFMEVIKKIMWRTCKQNVRNELCIPDQLNETHFIQLTDAETLFYDSQHMDCKEEFYKIVDKLILSTAAISQLNPFLLKKVLEPLRKLRQDCTVPVLFQKLKHTIVKKCLQPEELMQHLKSTNEIECKNDLRSITSDFNGLAALYIIMEEYQKAIEMYKNVLRYSKDYTGNVCVDSLIQIHAIYNLRWIYHIRKINRSEIFKLDVSLLKLEWKYLNQYYGNMQEAKFNYKSAHRQVSDFQKKENMGDSITELICVEILQELENKDCIKQLLAKFTEELSQKQLERLPFSNKYGLQYYLSQWLERLFSHRKIIIEKFQPLFNFMKLIKPNTECTPEMDQFIKETFDCHLKLIRLLPHEEENYVLNSKNKKKSECKLCKANNVIKKYECLLFDKEFDKTTKNTEGTWSPSVQENVLKLIISFAKNKILNISLIKSSEEILNLLDDLKKEFKTITKLWIEVEYLVKAYDELNMCIIRLQVDENFDGAENGNKVLYKIQEHEVPGHFEDLNNHLMMSKDLFARKLGRLRYLSYLEKGSDPDPCPICQTESSDKYMVLECGHHMCVFCFNNLEKQNKSYLLCAVCRNNQKFSDVYFVNMKKKSNLQNEDQIQIKGNYSTKVEEIVSLIIKLKNSNKDIKILLFSHWEPILKVISNALHENNIFNKLNWCTKSVDEFKSASLGITCLLLKLSNGSKGLNLIEATHVILVEPILNPGEELQAIGRVHRIGQTKVTTVHRFIVKNTIEEKIYNATTGANNWEFNKITMDQIKGLF